MKLFIINIGVNSAEAKKYFIKSPVFNDGSFELIPIMESSARAKYSTCTYGSLKCFNDKNKYLRNYIPEDYWEEIAHNDPEFATFTYGDNYIKPKGANFLKVTRGDILLFLARLYGYEGEEFIGNGDQYFIGYLTVQDIIINDKTKEINDDRLKRNAHYIRYKNGMGETFIILTGDPGKSFRFKHALRVTPEICEYIFNAKYISEHDIFISNETGDVLRNKNGNPRSFKNFHSITRTVQFYLDDKETAQKLAFISLFKKLNDQI